MFVAIGDRVNLPELVLKRASFIEIGFLRHLYMLIRSITLEAIFIVVPRLASHDLIFFVYTYY